MTDSLKNMFDRTDRIIVAWMSKYGLKILRVCLGIIFFWFGFLKFFPNLSPAQQLATTTISRLTFNLLSPETSLLILACWETFIGLGLIFGFWMRLILFLLWLQMLGTITPLFLFPAQTFTHFPYAPTLEGQYIIKNIVLISAALTLGSTVRQSP
jgi:uncharacterized membrane protein YphA (DoxX/SURF4 family)